MNKEAIKKIADTYGFSEQSRQLSEECAELIVAVNKYHRGIKKPSHTPSDCIDKQYLSLQIMEEIADVTIMIEQIKYLLSLNSDDIDLFIEQKLNRQLERIEKNETNN